MPKISVIIVHWNVSESLRRCLDSIYDSGFKNVEVIVVDNSQSKLRLPKVKLIQNAQNLGFPKAVNQGLSAALGDFFLILNPDTCLPKDFFTKALAFTKNHPSLGVMGPKLVNPDGSPQGSVFPEPGIINTLLQKYKYTPNTVQSIEVNAVSGACMWVPKPVIKKIGLFTEEVFMYYEDLDYCRRIRRAGLKVYFNPEIVVVHEHGQSSAKSSGATSKYLRDSSLWYNGPIKHYVMWFVAWLTQKTQKLFV